MVVRNRALRLIPKLPPSFKARSAAIKLGANNPTDVFRATRSETVPRINLGQSWNTVVKSASSQAVSFSAPVITEMRTLLGKLGFPEGELSKEKIASGLQALLLDPSDPQLAAFVRTVASKPELSTEWALNLARYNEVLDANPAAALPAEITNPAAALRRLSLIGFTGSPTLAKSLHGALQRDLAQRGEDFVAALKQGVTPDVAIIGQGPTASVLAERLSSADGARTVVIGDVPTFEPGAGWDLNSPTRATTDFKPGVVGGALNFFSNVMTDGDLSGRYYSNAGTMHQVTTADLHTSGTPVVTSKVETVSRSESGGYVLRTPDLEVPTKMVALAAGLGDSPKRLPSDAGTQFMKDQYGLADQVIDKARNGTLTKAELNEVQALSTLQHFRLSTRLNNPLSMMAPVFTSTEAVALNEGFPSSPAKAEYLQRALYKTRGEALAEVPAQRVVAVVGLGDSSRTAIESITAFGPDARSPRQLNIAPKVVWYVGESGPKDCAEFYVGDLVRGFEGVSDELAKKGVDFPALLGARIASRIDSNSSSESAIKSALSVFSELLTTAKPKELFKELLGRTSLTEAEREAAFSVFLKERDAVRPRYNSLVIPIEKGQVEIVNDRVQNVSDVTEDSVTDGTNFMGSVQVTESNGRVARYDLLLDGRGNENNVGELLSPITGKTTNPFDDPEAHELIKVIDPEGNEAIVGKRLKGEDIFLFGPAAGVVSENPTPVGANVVSIFLNAPLNQLGGEALAKEVMLRLESGQLGSAEERAGDAQVEDQIVARRSLMRLFPGRAERTFEFAPFNSLVRSPQELDPLAFEAQLNELLAKCRVPVTVRAQYPNMDLQVTRKSDPFGNQEFVVTGADALLGPVAELFQTPAGRALLASLPAGGEFRIERNVDPGTGELLSRSVNWF